MESQLKVAFPKAKVTCSKTVDSTTVKFRYKEIKLRIYQHKDKFVVFREGIPFSGLFSNTVESVIKQIDSIIKENNHGKTSDTYFGTGRNDGRDLTVR